MFVVRKKVRGQRWVGTNQRNESQHESNSQERKTKHSRHNTQNNTHMTPNAPCGCASVKATLMCMQCYMCERLSLPQHVCANEKTAHTECHHENKQARENHEAVKQPHHP